MKKLYIFILLLVFCYSCEKEIFTGLVGPNISKFSNVFVASEPKGYKLYIDNKYMNVSTPDSILFVSEGFHKLTLKHDFFADSSININVDKSSPLSLTFDMKKSSRFFAKVVCSSNPQGAKIFINDIPTNLSTPATITNVYPGENEIRFVKTLYRDDSLIVIAKGGQYTEIFRNLEDTIRTVSYKTNNSKIGSDKINKIVIDKSNNKWIGSIDHGLMKFNGRSWTSYENAGVMKGSRINDLLVDSRSRLWVASDKGLFVIDGAIWQTHNSILPSEYVTALEEDVSGNIWIATLSGLVKYSDNSTEVFTSQNTGFPLENLSSLSSSRSGEIWIGSNTSGILRFDGLKWNQFSTAVMELDTKNISDNITDLIVDDDGVLWSYHKGDDSHQLMRALISFNGVKWREVRFSLPFYLEGNSFYLDNEKNLWMSATGGLIKYKDPIPLKVLDHNENEFISKPCTSFIIDKNGDGWLTTLGGGMAKLKKGTF